MEIPCSGGRLTAGVVRIADTVRRPSKPSSPAVRSLLLHLETRGFSGAPRYLGIDEQGRDISSYVAGYVPPKWPSFPDDAISQAGKLLRAFHDATRGCELLSGKPVICHHDPAPNNVVFQENRPIAFIDFDLIAPGEPLEDLGYMAWSWCISSEPDRQPASMQGRKIALLADSYGIESAQRRDLFDAIVAGQVRNIEFWSRLREGRDVPITAHKIAEVIEWSRRERDYTLAHRAEFYRAFSDS